MNEDRAIETLLALGQRTRLAVYRLLIEYGDSGLSVSEIATSLSVNISTLSRHLRQLERAGLLVNRRRDRQIFYAIDFDGMDQLMGFLNENCCRSLPDECPDTRLS